MGSMQCNMEFGYQLSICSGTTENLVFNIAIRQYTTNRKVAGSISDEVNFYIYLILPAVLGPGVYSASNRNEYWEH
jgi:hypothetical protein